MGEARRDEDEPSEAERAAPGRQTFSPIDGDRRLGAIDEGSRLGCSAVRNGSDDARGRFGKRGDLDASQRKSGRQPADLRCGGASQNPQKTRQGGDDLQRAIGPGFGGAEHQWPTDDDETKQNGYRAANQAVDSRDADSMRGIAHDRVGSANFRQDADRSTVLIVALQIFHQLPIVGAFAGVQLFDAQSEFRRFGH